MVYKENKIDHMFLDLYFFYFRNWSRIIFSGRNYLWEISNAEEEFTTFVFVGLVEFLLVGDDFLSVQKAEAFSQRLEVHRSHSSLRTFLGFGPLSQPLDHVAALVTSFY